MPMQGRYVCASLHEGRFNRKPIIEPGHVVQTNATQQMPVRLKIIFDQTRSIIRHYKPDVVAVEQLVGVPKQVKQSAKIGHGYGAVICGVVAEGLMPVMYGPLTVKKTVTYKGETATDHDVYEAVKNILCLEAAADDITLKAVQQATDTGANDKDKVEVAVRNILNLPESVKVSHVSDALAIAVTHGTIGVKWTANARPALAGVVKGETIV